MAKEYKVKTLKNGEKRYIFDVNLGYRADGTRVRTTINAKSVKEGRKQVAQLTLGQKQVIENDSMLFKDAWSLYINDCKKKGVSTYPRETIYNKHYRAFYDAKMKRIKESDIINFINTLDPLLKNNTKHSIAATLKTFFYWCVKKKILNENVFKYIDPIKKEKSELNYWTEEEFQKFIKCVDNDYWSLVFTTLFYTGLRKGELFGLSYEDIRGNNLHLSHSIKIIDSKQVLSDSFKTDTSKRIVPIPKWLDLGKGEGLIFPTGYRTASWQLKRYIDKFNNLHEDKLKYIRIHDMRHSYISMLIFKKIDIFTISRVVGHTDIKMTTQIYGHLYDKTRDEISDIL